MKKADKNLLSGSTTLLVLSLLSSGDKYGYEMIAELEARSDHTFTLKEGTLYPILHTLEKDGAVKSYEKEAPTGRMRKYYRITRKGLRLLDEKKEEWVNLPIPSTPFWPEPVRPWHERPGGGPPPHHQPVLRPRMHVRPLPAGPRGHHGGAHRSLGGP